MMTTPASTPLSVQGDDLTLAAWDSGGEGPVVIFVHGFPDNHTVWDRVVDRLRDRYRCVTYDVRGAGASGVPPDREGYRMRHLVSDLHAVMTTVSPDAPVHLVGHDWGSVQCWDAVVRASSDPRLTGRIASFTTISGPCLQHVTAFFTSARRGDWDRRRAVAAQALRSWYVLAFQVPWVPELLLRHLSDDAAHSVDLYRANASGSEPVPGGPRTDLPVQLLVPLRDTYISPALTADVHRFAPDLTRIEIDAGHWVQRSRPDEVADLVAAFVDAHVDNSDGRG